MKPSIKQIWLNALRSGNYEQGRETLLDNGRFCCLGVLTDLFIQETNQEWHRDCGTLCSFKTEGVYSFEGEEVFLPSSVQEWAGLNVPNPYVAGQPLTTWNDEGASFEELADLIEEHL